MDGRGGGGGAAGDVVRAAEALKAWFLRLVGREWGRSVVRAGSQGVSVTRSGFESFCLFSNSKLRRVCPVMISSLQCNLNRSSQYVIAFYGFWGLCLLVSALCFHAPGAP